MTNIDIIKENVNKTIDEIEKLKNQVDELKEWNSPVKIITNFKSICSFVINLVMLIELTINDIADELINFDKDQKLEAAAQLLDTYIKLPIWAEPFDNYVYKCILSTVVTMLDTFIGKKWDIEDIRSAINNPEKNNLTPSLK